MSRAIAAMLCLLALACGGCDRELRKLAKAPPATKAPQSGSAQTEVVPGERGAGLVETSQSRTYDGENAFEMAQGKRLFRWMNCSGCHANGGGGMGPALMDHKWFYGYEPEQIFQTIMDGRPNGMPAFRGRLTEEQAWQLVAYVRSMSGQAPKAAAPSRNDSLAVVEPEARRKRLDPVVSGPPPAPTPPSTP